MHSHHLDLENTVIEQPELEVDKAKEVVQAKELVETIHQAFVTRMKELVDESTDNIKIKDLTKEQLNRLTPDQLAYKQINELPGNYEFNLLKLCAVIETFESPQNDKDEKLKKEAIKEFAKHIAALRKFLMINHRLCQLLNIKPDSFEQLISQFPKLEPEYELPSEVISDVLFDINQKVIKIDNYTPEVQTLINSFQKELKNQGKKDEKTNYYTCHAIIQQQLNKFQPSTFDFGKNKKTKLIFLSYLKEFEKQFLTRFQQVMVATEIKKELKNKPGSVHSPSPNYPVEFSNPHVQIFNYNVCRRLDAQIRKAQSGIGYRINEWFRGNQQIDTEVSFLMGISAKLKNVNNFVESPGMYIEIIHKITDYLQKPNVSDASVKILKGLRAQIYANVILKNEPGNGFSGLNKEENKKFPIKFYSKISKSQSAFATWDYSKRYLSNLKKDLVTIENGYTHTQLLRKLIKPAEVANTLKLIRDLNKEISTLLSIRAVKDHRFYVLQYIELMVGKIRLLRDKKNRKFYDYPAEVIATIQKHAITYIDFILTDNDKKFVFDGNSIEFLKSIRHELSTAISVDDDELTKDFTNEKAKFQDTKIENIFKETDRSEFKIAEEKNQVKAEEEQIANDQEIRPFYQELETKLQAHFLTALIMQRDGFVKKSSQQVCEIEELASIGGQGIGLIPGVGEVLATAAHISTAMLTGYLTEKHNRAMSANAKHVQLDKINLFASYIARKLTQIFEHQVRLLSPSSYKDFINAIIERIGNGIAQSSEKNLDTLAQIAIRSVLESYQLHGYLGLMSITLDGKKTEEYTAEGMFASYGVVVYDEKNQPTYYRKRSDETDKKYKSYGFRRGTMFDVEEHYLVASSPDELTEAGLDKNSSRPHQLSFTGYTSPNIMQKENSEMLNQHQNEIIVLKKENEDFKKVVAVLTEDNKVLKQEIITLKEIQEEKQATKVVRQQAKESEKQANKGEVVALAGENKMLIQKVAYQENKIAALEEQLAKQAEQQAKQAELLAKLAELIANKQAEPQVDKREAVVLQQTVANQENIIAALKDQLAKKDLEIDTLESVREVAQQRVSLKLFPPSP